MKLVLTQETQNQLLGTQFNGNNLDSWKGEIRSYLGAMKDFRAMPPDEIFMALSSYTARASEIRSFLLEVDNRSNTAFRTKQIDPFIDECERQFKYWSRIVSVQQTEIEMAGRIM